MKRLALIAVAIAIATPAMAQWTTTPNVMGAPQYGFTTRGPNGEAYNTQQRVMGAPEYGTVTTGPNGRQCTTTMRVMGAPQYGTTTTCN